MDHLILSPHSFYLITSELNEKKFWPERAQTLLEHPFKIYIHKVLKIKWGISYIGFPHEKIELGFWDEKLRLASILVSGRQNCHFEITLQHQQQKSLFFSIIEMSLEPDQRNRHHVL